MRILIVVVAIVLSSCASWHCRKCIQSGKIKPDTVGLQVTVEKVIHDTIASEPLFIERLLAGDTVKIETTKWKVREHYNTVTKERLVEVECPEQTVNIEIPCGDEIQVGWPRGPVIGVGLFLLVLAFFAGRGFRRSR